MKKVLKSIIPSIIMLLLIYLWRDGKDILNGLYIVFPILYIITGIVCSDIKKELLLSLMMLSISFLIPINYMFNMGSCIDCAIIYNLLGLISYIIKKKTNNKKIK